MDKKMSTDHIIEVSSNGQKVGEKSYDPRFLFFLALILFIPLMMDFIYWFNEHERGQIENYPKFSIEAITISNFNISSSSLPPYYSSLSAQNLTINFLVENPAPREVDYERMGVLIFYKGDILWAKPFDLYHQQKGERTSV